MSVFFEFLAAILLSNDVKGFPSSHETFTDCARFSRVLTEVFHYTCMELSHMMSGENCDVMLKCIVLCGAAAVRPNFGRRAVVTSCHSTIGCDSKYVRKLKALA